jgi:hypothetical protein
MFDERSLSLIPSLPGDFERNTEPRQSVARFDDSGRLEFLKVEYIAYRL